MVKEFYESKTAKEPGREIFNEMLGKIEKGTAQGILAWNPDRLARNSIDGGRVIYLVDTQKIVALKFPTFWFEATPQGKFMLSVAFGQAKYYTDNLNLSKQENLSGMKDFLVDIGSNRRLAAGMLLAEFKMPWRDLAETLVRARAFGAGEVNLSSNSELWCYSSICSNFFRPRMNRPATPSQSLGNPERKTLLTFLIWRG